MIYRPNFCAECGARVERTRWRVWTSRRFCPGCDVRLHKRLIAPALAVCACLVALGFLLGRAGRPAPPPLTITRVSPPATGEPATKSGSGVESAERADALSRGAEALEQPTDPLEVVSICGARTKKGTPCSRRVRGTGRCWQHRGKPAILPPEKLIVEGS